MVAAPGRRGGSVPLAPRRERRGARIKSCEGRGRQSQRGGAEASRCCLLGLLVGFGGVQLVALMEGDEAPVTNDDVVEHAEPEEASPSDELMREVEVLNRRFRVPRGVV